MTTRTKLYITSYTVSAMILLNVFSKPLHIPEGFQWVLIIGVFIPLGLTFYFIKQQKLERQAQPASTEAAGRPVTDPTQSTKQRFVASDFDYPTPEVEARIIQHESGISPDVATTLVRIGEKVRHLKHHGLEEGVSTRLLVYTGMLIRQGIPPQQACEAAIARPLTDDPDIQRTIRELVSAVL